MSSMSPKPVAKAAANVLFVKKRINGSLNNAATRYETPAATRPTQPIEFLLRDYVPLAQRAPLSSVPHIAAAFFQLRVAIYSDSVFIVVITERIYRVKFPLNFNLLSAVSAVYSTPRASNSTSSGRIAAFIVRTISSTGSSCSLPRGRMPLVRRPAR